MQVPASSWGLHREIRISDQFPEGRRYPPVTCAACSCCSRRAQLSCSDLNLEESNLSWAPTFNYLELQLVWVSEVKHAFIWQSPPSLGSVQIIWEPQSCSSGILEKSTNLIWLTHRCSYQHWALLAEVRWQDFYHVSIQSLLTLLFIFSSLPGDWWLD